MNPRKKFIELEDGRIVRNKHRRTTHRLRRIRVDQRWREQYERECELRGRAPYPYWEKSWKTLNGKSFNKPPKRWRKAMKYEGRARTRSRMEIQRGDEATFFKHRRSAHWDWW